MAIKISGTTVINDDRNIENVGVTTATSFSGNGSGLTGVGVGTEDNINTSGIVTASTISANEFIGTGDKLIFSPSATSFSPIDGSTDQDRDSNIIITFDQPIYAGVGSIFLRNSSGIGTEIDSIGITSTSISISNQTLTINPPTDLPLGTDVYVVLPSQSIKNSVGGFISTLSNYNFSTLSFAYSSISPADGASSVASDSNIVITFTSPPVRGTGTVELRYTSASGTLIESFDAASASEISISGNTWILNPSNSIYGPTAVFLVVPNTAITNFAGINVSGGEFTYSFTSVSPALGAAYEGGYLICASGGTRWVVAPSSSEVTRNWYNRNDANTRAQAVSGCTGWFVPTISQIQNPGYTCRTYWDSFQTSFYWSSTQSVPHANFACGIPFTHGGAGIDPKPDDFRVRAFRCVSY
jgi:hypothetical protein